MVKTYEEFNWNPFKKNYNDYIGLDYETLKDYGEGNKEIIIDIFNNMKNDQYKKIMSELKIYLKTKAEKKR